jgi:hypothetical protein
MVDVLSRRQRPRDGEDVSFGAVDERGTRGARHETSEIDALAMAAQVDPKRGDVAARELLRDLLMRADVARRLVQQDDEGMRAVAGQQQSPDELPAVAHDLETLLANRVPRRRGRGAAHVRPTRGAREQHQCYSATYLHGSLWLARRQIVKNGICVGPLGCGSLG